MPLVSKTPLRFIETADPISSDVYREVMESIEDNLDKLMLATNTIIDVSSIGLAQEKLDEAMAKIAEVQSALDTVTPVVDELQTTKADVEQAAADAEASKLITQANVISTNSDATSAATSAAQAEQYKIQSQESFNSISALMNDFSNQMTVVGSVEYNEFEIQEESA